MAERLNLEIITPQQIVLQTAVDWVTIPGSEGELGVLPGHVPLVTTLDSGILQFESDGRKQTVAVHYGYAQVRGSTVTVLSDMAERADEIDLGRARDAEEKARQALGKMVGRQNTEEERLQKFEAKLKRAIMRQSVGG